MVVMPIASERLAMISSCSCFEYHSSLRDYFFSITHCNAAIGLHPFMPRVSKDNALRRARSCR